MFRRDPELLFFWTSVSAASSAARAGEGTELIECGEGAMENVGSSFSLSKCGGLVWNSDLR